MLENSKENIKERGEKECWEEKQNLLGFFGLLLEIDMRENPHLYKKKLNTKKKDDR